MNERVMMPHGMAIVISVANFNPHPSSIRLSAGGDVPLPSFCSMMAFG